MSVLTIKPRWELWTNRCTSRCGLVRREGPIIGNKSARHWFPGSSAIGRPSRLAILLVLVGLCVEPSVAELTGV